MVSRHAFMFAASAIIGLAAIWPWLGIAIAETVAPFGFPAAAGGPYSAASAPVQGPVFVHYPPNLATLSKPVQVVIALHGMGDTGSSFAANLVPLADRYGWILVAPTLNYGDWHVPAVVAREDASLAAWAADYLDTLPKIAGTQLRSQVFLFGHSRGAQVANRIAELRPDRVAAVAAISGGSYTLPVTTMDDGAPAPLFPFGVSDLSVYGGKTFDIARFKQIRFLVAVGGDDTDPSDLPRQWDPFIGNTRLQRARRFEATLAESGVHAALQVFPSVGHMLTNEMRQDACLFLDRATRARPNRVQTHGFLTATDADVA